jgi:uncharacterized GH25 family protein
MKSFIKPAALAFALAATLPLTLQAHRGWMLPSATVLSGDDPWVTVDAAISNDLFYFEHFPMRLENLVVTAPDGTIVKPENASTGRYRSTFDVHLTQKGTYKLANASTMVMASYDEGGQLKRWRGTEETFAKEVPKDAKGLAVSRTSSRMEVFVTSGKPTDTVLKTTGVGLELAPITHPNDLVTGEPAKFQFLLDGKPAANVEVTLIPGGIRYRDQLKEVKVKTDAEGKFSVTFADPGMYWMNASAGTGGGRGPGGPPPSPQSQNNNAQPAGEPEGGPGGPSAEGPQTQSAPEQPAQGNGPARVQGNRQGGPRGPGGPGGPGGGPQGPVTPGRRATYIATLEVLPQ